VPEAPVNGIRLYYEEHGEGAPIACIHGTGSSALVWGDAVEKLARLGRVITYDRRGHTRSERPEPYERTTVTEHADDAAALLDALAAVPAVVIGRSYGGTVATDLALRYPDRVRALVLLEADAPGLAPAADGWVSGLNDRLREVAGQAGVDAVGEALINEVAGESAWRSCSHRAGRWRPPNRSGGPRGPRLHPGSARTHVATASVTATACQPGCSDATSCRACAALLRCANTSSAGHAAPLTRGCRTNPNRADRSPSPHGLTIGATLPSWIPASSYKASGQPLQSLSEHPQGCLPRRPFMRQAHAKGAAPVR